MGEKKCLLPQLPVYVTSESFPAKTYKNYQFCCFWGAVEYSILHLLLDSYPETCCVQCFQHFAACTRLMILLQGEGTCFFILQCGRVPLTVVPQCYRSKGQKNQFYIWHDYALTLFVQNETMANTFFLFEIKLFCFCVQAIFNS